MTRLFITLLLLDLELSEHISRPRHLLKVLKVSLHQVETHSLDRTPVEVGSFFNCDTKRPDSDAIARDSKLYFRHHIFGLILVDVELILAQSDVDIRELGWLEEQVLVNHDFLAGDSAADLNAHHLVRLEGRGVVYAQNVPFVTHHTFVQLQFKIELGEVVSVVYDSGCGWHWSRTHEKICVGACLRLRVNLPDERPLALPLEVKFEKLYDSWFRKAKHSA